MPIGRGKYDDFCTMVRNGTDCDLAIVMVIGGKLGSGFSAQASDTGILDLMSMPDKLRYMADQIEADMKKGRI